MGAALTHIPQVRLLLSLFLFSTQGISFSNNMKQKFHRITLHLPCWRHHKSSGQWWQQKAKALLPQNWLQPGVRSGLVRWFKFTLTQGLKPEASLPLGLPWKQPWAGWEDAASSAFRPRWPLGADPGREGNPLLSSLVTQSGSSGTSPALSLLPCSLRCKPHTFTAESKPHPQSAPFPLLTQETQAQQPLKQPD